MCLSLYSLFLLSFSFSISNFSSPSLLLFAMEITEEYSDEPISRFQHDHDRPIDAPLSLPMHPSSSKRNGGGGGTTATGFLVFVLQAVVMTAALFLFFIFAGIAALVLIHLFIAGSSFRRRRRRRVVFDAPKEGGVIGLSQEELERLPSTRFTSKGRHAVALRWPDCAVCLEGIREGERCRVLPGCRHGFHKACVDKWLVRSAVCPVCRAAVSGGSDRGCRR